MSLILPHGLGQKHTIELSVDEMAWLANGEDICRKLGLTIVCFRCLMGGMKLDSVLKGNNSPSDHTISVSCQCRRLTYRAAAES